MKSKLRITLAIITLTAFSCGKTEYQPHGDCLTILLDRTEEYKANKRISVNEFLPLLKVTSSDNKASATVRLAPISNLRFEEVYSAGIVETTQYDVNEIDRKDLLKKFIRQLEDYMNLINSTPYLSEGSAIFETIAKQLDELSICNPGTSKRLVVVSDLLQNVEWFNAYDPKQLKAFVNNPDCFEKKMDTYCPINRPIKGIIINLVHQPQSVIEDNQFYQISNLLKGYYEGKGSIVHISARIK